MTKYEELLKKINDEVSQSAKEWLSAALIDQKPNTDFFLKIELANFIFRNKGCLSFFAVVVIQVVQLSGLGHIAEHVAGPGKNGPAAKVDAKGIFLCLIGVDEIQPLGGGIFPCGELAVVGGGQLILEQDLSGGDVVDQDLGIFCLHHQAAVLEQKIHVQHAAEGKL